MISLRQSLVLATLFLSALSSPTRQDQQQQQQQEERQSQPPLRPANVEEFQRLLADLEESSSLHSALHLWSSKFKDGVFSHDRTALEAVHSENAPVATSLLNIAKRQSNDSTTISISPSSTIVAPNPNTPPLSSSTPSDESSQSPSDQSPPPTPSTSDGVVLPVSSRTTATRAPTTQAVPVSTPPSATPIATSNDRVVYSISGSSSSGSSGGSGGSGGGLTTVDATSQLISYSPSSSTVLSTLTLPDGTISTQTSVTVVDAPVTGGTLGAPAASATGGSSTPSLQEGVASATRGLWKEVVAVVGGAVVMALAM